MTGSPLQINVCGESFARILIFFPPQREHTVSVVIQAGEAVTSPGAKERFVKLMEKTQKNNRKAHTSRFDLSMAKEILTPLQIDAAVSRLIACYMADSGNIPDTIQGAIQQYPAAKLVICDSGSTEDIRFHMNEYIQDVFWLSAIQVYLKNLGCIYPEVIRRVTQAFVSSLPQILSQAASGKAIKPEQILPNSIITHVNRDVGIIVILALLFQQRELIRRGIDIQKDREQKKTEQLKDLRKQNKELEERFADSHRRAAVAERKLQQLQLTEQSRKEPETDGIIDSLQASIRAQRREIAELQSALEQAENALAEKEHRVYLLESELADPQSKPWMDLALPETGVVFAGGNPNCVKKWKKLYPKWCFISSENPSAALPSKVNVVFLCPNHTISHSLYEFIKQNIPDRQKYCYVSSTNLDLLDEEMRFEYWKMQNP